MLFILVTVHSAMYIVYIPGTSQNQASPDDQSAHRTERTLQGTRQEKHLEQTHKETDRMSGMEYFVDEHQQGTSLTTEVIDLIFCIQLTTSNQPLSTSANFTFFYQFQ